MILIISQNIRVKGSKIPYSLQKVYGERNVLPRVGDLLEDSVWKNPYEYAVTEVVFNYQENTCHVTVAPFADEIPESKLEEFAHMAKLHEWKASWYQFQ